MQRTRTIRSIAVTGLAASVLAASAAAGGEPKNEWPFTRQVVARTTQAATFPRPTVEPVIQGEPKNEPPFTRPVTTGAAGTAPATIVIRSSQGFSWADAAIGLAAGIGIAASAAGALSLTHKSPQPA
jgi:hypothetical protein